MELIKRFYSKNKKICVNSAIGLFALVFFVLNMFIHIMPTVALEQEARCGITEHIHTDLCFNNDILVCDKTAHVHDTNCYIVLLGENDINDLLTEIDNSDERSLESVIDSTVSNAMLTMKVDEQTASTDKQDVLEIDLYEEVLRNQNNSNSNTDSNSTTDSGQTESISPTIAQINNVSQQSNTPVVLNEQVVVKAAAPTATGGASTYAVGDSPVSGNYNANFYVYLDGRWTCIGTETFSVTRSGNSYEARIPTNDAMNLINGALGTNFTRTQISLYYATSSNATNYTAATVGSSNVVLGTASRQNSLRSARYVRVVLPGQNGNSTALSFNSVTYEHLNGSEDIEYVRTGSSVVLPEGYTWTDDLGRTYIGGDQVTISRKTTFTASLLVDESRVILNYSVAFPQVSGITPELTPTVDGASTAQESIDEFNSATIKHLSHEQVIGDMGNDYADSKRIFRFKGWKIDGTEVVLMPNSVVTWDSLKSFATAGQIDLTAQWDYSPFGTCMFYVKYDSVATTTGQDVTAYTPCIFTSYVENIDPDLNENELTNLYGVNIDAVTDQEVLEVDKLVRAKYGSRQSEPYLISFPDDAYIFEQLKDYADTLTVDGVKVKVDDLNENGYAIRWYVFKCQNDAWHVDGKLVRKHGHIDVTKSFAGNRTAIDMVKQNFYIEAVGSEKGTERLTLNNYIDYDSTTNTYTWRIQDIAYGEQWQLTEKNYEASGYDVYGEYIITDASATQSGTGEGDSVSLMGMTYASDLGEQEVLQVDFFNVYRVLDSLIIKKEDSETGRALAGAKFMLEQNGELLKFRFDDATDTYHHDDNGTITELACENSGFLEVSIKDISYDEGDITIIESQVPSGYAGSAGVVLGCKDDGTIGILSEVNATFNDDILVIPNTSNTITVTAQKTWLCNEYNRKDIEIQLLADGRPVNAIFPAVKPSATLTAGNNYSYTWENLAAYANGQQITWSVRETKIGDESCKSDFTFANWLVYYSPPQYTRDEQGNITEVLIPVANDIQRLALRVTKTNIDKTKTLRGATFVLTKVDDNFQNDTNFTPVTLTTAANGEMIFTDLTYGTYSITETVAPQGYEVLQEPVYVTINGDNTISVSDNFYVEVDASSSLSIIVKNSEPIPIPETGGIGTGIFYVLSLCVMALAVYIYNKFCKVIIK